MPHRAPMVGIGETDYVRRSLRSAAEPMLEAATVAVCHAGVSPQELDSVVSLVVFKLQPVASGTASSCLYGLP